MNENKSDCFSRLAVVLPSLDPDYKFDAVVQSLLSAGFERIVIVDDGTAAENKHHFVDITDPRCSLITHPVNMGKGRALKDAFRFVLDNYPRLAGVVTIDGDGQHLTKDIIACCERMLEQGDKVVLGCRNFDLPGIPPRSVTGNKTTSALFKYFFRMKLSDTQTGLRAIPMQYLEFFCDIGGERFEYETNVLLMMKRKGIEFYEQRVETVYDPEDYSSHYNTLKDTLRIAGIMFKYVFSGSAVRFMLSSFSSWAVDNAVYLSLFALFLYINGLPDALWSAIAFAIARIVSSFINFNMNKYYVFSKGEAYWLACGKYYALAVPMALVSLVLLSAVIRWLSVSRPILATGIKILIEAVLFIINYYVQKIWVYKKRNK